MGNQQTKNTITDENITMYLNEILVLYLSYRLDKNKYDDFKKYFHNFVNNMKTSPTFGFDDVYTEGLFRSFIIYLDLNYKDNEDNIEMIKKYFTKYNELECYYSMV